MIQFRNTSIFMGGECILKDIHEHWDGKGILFLVGANGAGKSTLLKSLVGLVPYKGSICYDGQEICEMSDQTRVSHFGYVAQEKELPLHETVEDFLMTGTAFKKSLFGQPKSEDLKKAKEVMERFSLEMLSGKYMDELSGGERQMLYVARCFMERHDVIVLDEPCVYLDYQRQYRFLLNVSNHLKEEGVGAIISIHDPNLALLFGDEAFFLHQGTVWHHQRMKERIQKEQFVQKWNAIYPGLCETIEDEDMIWIHWKKEGKEQYVKN